jgi:hypothetical protein
VSVFFKFSLDKTVDGSLTIMEAGLMPGNTSPGTNDFYFFPAQPGSEPKMFLINTVANSAWRDKTVAAYGAEFGAPAKIAHETVQNRLGASLQNTVITYENPSSTIVIRRRATSLDTFSVVYSFKSIMNVVLQNCSRAIQRAGKRL